MTLCFELCRDPSSQSTGECILSGNTGMGHRVSGLHSAKRLAERWNSVNPEYSIIRSNERLRGSKEFEQR